MGLKRYKRSTTTSLFKGISTAAKIANRVYKAEQQEAKRREREIKRNIARREREAAAAERQRIREAERQAREQARLAKESEKLLKQMQIELEVNSIIEENQKWTTVHMDVSTLISDTDFTQAIEDAEFEKKEIMYQGLFEEEIPDKSIYKNQATTEAISQFGTSEISNELNSRKSQLQHLQFNEIEPTEETVYIELKDEAKNSIKAFWPWKKKRLVNEYIQQHLSSRLNEKHNIWANAKQNYESNVESLTKDVEKLENNLQDALNKERTYIEKRTEELYNQDFTSWKSRRDQFYDNYIANLRGLLNGEQSYIEDAFSDTLADNDLPMEYYVESMYDETTGVVKLDVDLPEVEDIPQQKIITTSTGKQSIRNKTSKDLNEDYAQCICGLAIYLAEDMFNISPKIKNVVISGFTQRPDAKTSLVTDQYVYVIDFNRETFNKINYEKFTAFQVFSFFKNHINATKTLVLKEIDINTAYDKVQKHVPVDYDEFILQHPEYAQKSIKKSKSIPSTGSTTVTTSTSATSSSPSSAQAIYARATILSDKLYQFVSSLDNNEIKKHVDELRGVNITVTSPTKGLDCDLSTYRGKLFFLCISDLYNSLKQMGVNLYSAKEPLYVYAMLIIKIYAQRQAEYQKMPSILSLTYTFNSSFTSTIAQIPSVPRKYLIFQLMYDFSDLSYYRQYHELLNAFAEFVDDTCGNNLLIKNAVKKYKSQLFEYIL